MNIRFQCESCAKWLSADESALGRAIRCPYCRATITVRQTRSTSNADESDKVSSRDAKSKRDEEEPLEFEQLLSQAAAEREEAAKSDARSKLDEEGPLEFEQLLSDSEEELSLDAELASVDESTLDFEEFKSRTTSGSDERDDSKVREDTEDSKAFELGATLDPAAAQNADEFDDRPLTAEEQLATLEAMDKSAAEDREAMRQICPSFEPNPFGFSLPLDRLIEEYNRMRGDGANPDRQKKQEKPQVESYDVDDLIKGVDDDLK